MMNSSLFTPHQRAILEMPAFDPCKEDFFLTGHDFSFLDELNKEDFMDMSKSSSPSNESCQKCTAAPPTAPGQDAVDFQQDIVDRLKKERDAAIAKSQLLEQELDRTKLKAAGLQDELDRQQITHEKQLAFLLYEYLPFNGQNMRQTNILGPVNHGLVEDYQRAGNYIIGAFLGEGCFGEVYQGTCRKTRNQFAIKCLKKDRMNCPDKMQQLEQELMILKYTDHPNLIKMKEVLHTPSHVYIVMDLGYLDVYTFVRQHCIEERALRQIALGVLKALEYLHGNGICHMDIKPENIMVMKDVSACSLKEEHIKLCDFGLCSVKDAFSSKDSAVLYSGVKGTPGYFAPEMIVSGQEQFNDARAADMWSVGCTLLDLAQEYPVELTEAYDHCMEDMAEFYKAIQRILMMFRDSDHFDEDSGVFDVIRGCLRMNPKKRHSASECLKNEWFDDELEEAEKVLMPGTDLASF